MGRSPKTLKRHPLSSNFSVVNPIFRRFLLSAWSDSKGFDLRRIHLCSCGAHGQLNLRQSQDDVNHDTEITKIDHSVTG